MEKKNSHIYFFPVGLKYIVLDGVEFTCYLFGLPLLSWAFFFCARLAFKLKREEIAE